MRDGLAEAKAAEPQFAQTELFEYNSMRFNADKLREQRNETD